MPGHSKLRNNYLPEAAFWLKKKKTPRMVTVNLTRRCNQHCIYCEIGADSGPVEKDRLTVDTLRWIIDQMEQSGIRKLALCGGEPFLFDGIMDIIGYAGQKNIQCAVTSNGMTVHQLNEQDLELLKTSGTILHLSVDSFDENLQSRTRGHKNALKNALKSIHRLAEFNIPVTMLTVISRHNYKDLYQSALLALKNGIREIVYQPVISFSNYPEQEAIQHKKDLNISPSEIPVLLEQLSQIERLEQKHAMNTNVYRIKPWIGVYLQCMALENGTPFYKKITPRFYCREVEAVIDISYDGGIQPCGLQPAKMFIQDHKEKNLVEQWQEAIAPLTSDLKQGQFPESCRGCCHKFSRNMIASAMKYPYNNRAILGTLISSMLLRSAARLKRPIQSTR